MSKFATRMRELQMSSNTVLPSRSWNILQLDGKSFHTWTRGLDEPFDEQFINNMNLTAQALMETISGAKFAYVQSDEINILLTDFDTPTTQPYHGNRVQKIVSTSAGLASAYMSKAYPHKRFAIFDARMFNCPSREDVSDWFIWRQQDAMKNSVRSVAHSHFSHKLLMGKNTSDVKNMLTGLGDPWEGYSDGERFGRVIVKRSFPDERTFFHMKKQENQTVEFMATRWVAEGAPVFRETSFLEDNIPVKDEL